MTLPLTPKQERVWRYIKSCERSPTFDEMRRALGLSGKGGSLYETIKTLERKGFVHRTPGVARSLIAINPASDLSAFPTHVLAAELARRLAA